MKRNIYKWGPEFLSGGWWPKKFEKSSSPELKFHRWLVALVFLIYDRDFKIVQSLTSQREKAVLSFNLKPAFIYLK